MLKINQIKKNSITVEFHKTIFCDMELEESTLVLKNDHEILFIENNKNYWGGLFVDDIVLIALNKKNIISLL